MALNAWLALLTAIKTAVLMLLIIWFWIALLERCDDDDDWPDFV